MSFRPEPVPYTDDVSYIREWLGRQFNNLVGAFEVVDLVQLDELHIEPERAVVGMIRFADGTDWDPGNGRGLYVYDGTNWLQVIATTGGDLNAIEAIGTTGILTRTGSETWATRTITGTANEIEVTNGNGVSGNPTIGIPTNPTLTGQVTISNTGDGAVLLELESERPWRFIQASTGATTELNLRPDTGNKVFRIQDSTATNIASFTDGAMTADSELVVLSGIRFPITAFVSGNANTLDDYEEGTWTPSLRFGGGNTGMTGFFSGVYTKIGDFVFAGMQVALTAMGSSTGQATITGLPFSIPSIPDFQATITYGINLTGLTSPLTIDAGIGTTINLRDWGATGATALSDANFTDTSQVRIGLTYKV